jgi:predicted GNAT family N-acyltransferase
MSQSLIIRPCATEEDRAAAMRIRVAVFVDEQNVAPDLEPDEYDADALHLLVIDRESGAAVGTARIVDKGNGVAKIGRVAIRREWRGKGIGDLLMRETLEAARAAGHTTAVLDAQTYVIPFYEKLGFTAEGPVFDDAGIPHRRMTRPV